MASFISFVSSPPCSHSRRVNQMISNRKMISLPLNSTSSLLFLLSVDISQCLGLLYISAVVLFVCLNLSVASGLFVFCLHFFLVLCLCPFFFNLSGSVYLAFSVHLPVVCSLDRAPAVRVPPTHRLLAGKAQLLHFKLICFPRVVLLCV